jgi:cytochrome c biogenesis protein CcmG/thiol:disulfide interchange protein DsbE
MRASRRQRIVALALSLAACSCTTEPEPSYLRVRETLPAFSHPASARHTLVVFWAAWCEPCVREADDLAALAEDPVEGLSIVVYSHDATTAPAEERFAAAIGPAFEVRSDADRTIGAEFGVERLPASFLVTGRTLAARFDGPRSWSSDGMRRLLRRLIEERG